MCGGTSFFKICMAISYLEASCLMTKNDKNGHDFPKVVIFQHPRVKSGYPRSEMKILE